MTEQASRRLPVYFLLDCSESMVGQGISCVQEGMAGILDELRSDPDALDSAWVSVIQFSDTAELRFGLAEIPSVVAPSLRVRPGTALGAALLLLVSRMKEEVRRTTATEKGDFRPLVFLLTDGRPTDIWETAAASLRASGAVVRAIACGPNADTDVLKEIAGEKGVLLLHDDSPQGYKELFKLISWQVSMTSKRAGDTSEKDFAAAAIASGVVSALPASGSTRRRSTLDEELFLSVRCSTHRRPYLLRYQLAVDGSGYDPVRVHLIDDDYLDGGASPSGTRRVRSEQIHGILSCPRCENTSVAHCPSCAQMFCVAASRGEVTCPWCGACLKKGSGGKGAAFDVPTRIG